MDIKFQAFLPYGEDIRFVKLFLHFALNKLKDKEGLNLVSTKFDSRKVGEGIYGFGGESGWRIVAKFIDTSAIEAEQTLLSVTNGYEGYLIGTLEYDELSQKIVDYFYNFLNYSKNRKQSPNCQLVARSVDFDYQENDFLQIVSQLKDDLGYEVVALDDNNEKIKYSYIIEKNREKFYVKYYYPKRGVLAGTIHCQAGKPEVMKDFWTLFLDIAKER